MKFGFLSCKGGSLWGGSEYLWAQTALRLRAMGHEVTASVRKKSKVPDGLRELERAGVRVHFQSQSLVRRALRVARTKSGLPLPVHEPVRAWLRAEKPEFICVNNGNYSDDVPALEWVVESGVPFVNIAHVSAPNFWPADEKAARVRPIFAAARRCLFVSEGSRRLMEDQLGVDLPNAEIVRNPFNVPWTANPPWPEPGGPWSFACVGRLEPVAKGQDLLFHVLAMDKWRGRELELVLYGGGSCEDGVKRLAQRLRLGDRVRFAGQVSGIEQIWAKHHALALPSRYEGLPLALVEAMLCGRTAVVTDVAGNAEPLRDNVTGFVAASPTVAALDEAMERAWARREEWRAMGALAAKDIRKMMPADPARAFAERLVELAGKRAG